MGIFYVGGVMSYFLFRNVFLVWIVEIDLEGISIVERLIFGMLC